MSISSPSNTLPLLKSGRVSFEEALIDQYNVLHRLNYPKKQEEFWSYLVSRKSDIEAIVRFHLTVDRCQVADESQWLYGSYNVCIPVYINWPADERVLVRIPLPYKIGEAHNPGNVEEKLRCEVATYIWMAEHCPAVPIPSLHAFAFPNGRTLYRGWSTALGHLGDKQRRNILFHDISRIMLSINRTALPRIGSLTLNDDGFIHLTNRPLTLRLQTMENEGIPTIPRHSTYGSIEPYILDMLQCHDNRIRRQPNAIHSTNDGEQQLAALTMMRGLLPQFVSREHRDGQFVLTLTDLHPSNIFVDDDWHITSLIDLEWACSFPIEMQTAPYWLNRSTYRRH
ncbi:predicted protein [Uncinocarpus reesii 1704]|uniref:Uncharacterized protein n=1 Tax=Uncinocarpus reesii (strain UAMH 1704) TaxID=336963 RepID=C4JXC8_UNCRE|nr:uncharacterized protein UREG_06301 [Uncinocarpus reesii 1704]EEP81436.1 predicted protein [Uncinocarpus reesii 1704]